MVGPAGAPPRKEISKKRNAKWDKVSKDAEKKNEIDDMFARNKYYDPNSIRTRTRRAFIRTDYETACETLYEMTEHDQFWAKDDIIERQKRYIAYYVEVASGKIGDRIKVGSLYEAKYALYWWNAHFVPDFSHFFLKWHVEMMKWIHQVATTKRLTTASRPKNFLSSAEVLMLFDVVMGATSGVDNWKQHYAAWLLSFGTGCRPGSITVGQGYSAGDTLSDGSARGVDETLRWKDITWLKNGEGQVCFKLELRYLKNERDPYNPDHKSVEAQRMFLYLPLKTGPLALDLTLILLGLAVNRGLFNGGLEYVLNTDDEQLQTDSIVKEQPVFLSTDTKGQPIQAAMRIGSLNPKLQEALILAGLPTYNTMYSFRREAIRDTKVRYGTETAKELAGHAPDSTAITYYDTIGLGDVDLQAVRTQAKGMSRQEAWNLINPIIRQKYVKHGDDFKESLLKERNARVEEALLRHPEVGENADKLKRHIDSVRTFLQSRFGTDREIPTGYAQATVVSFKAMLSEVPDEEDPNELLTGFHSLAQTRKATMKKLRKSLRVTELQKIAEEMQSLRKIGKKAATTGLKVGASSNKAIQKQAATATVDIDQLAQDNLNALEAVRREDLEDATSDEEGFGLDGIDDDDGAEEGLNEEAYNEFTAAQDERSAPLAWEDGRTIEGVVLDVELEEDDPQYKENEERSRVAFLQKWVAKKSTPSSGLECFMCVQSPFTTKEDKEKRWPLAKLEKHYKTDHHAAETSIAKAAREVTTAGGKPRCPVCDTPYSNAAILRKHLINAHQMLMTGVEPEDSPAEKKRGRSKKKIVSEEEEAELDAEVAAEEAEAEAEASEGGGAGPSRPTSRRTSRQTYTVPEDESDEDEADDGEEAVPDTASVPYVGKGKGKA